MCVRTDGMVWLTCACGTALACAGQQFSTRVDVLSPEFVQQLEMLQDNVPPFSPQAAVATIERGLGKPITEAFEECAPWQRPALCTYRWE